MNALTQAVRAALEQCGLWRDGARLICALSGGCDSVALLHALSRLRGEKQFSIHAVHVQHGLRGAASQADEQFVRDLCEALNVPLTVINAGLSGDMHTPGMETMARERRRQIFAEQIRALQADALLTAHHRDDQAETVLMHLLRGSGLQGLCGMALRVPFAGALLVRPFLSVPKQQLQTALESENLPFREDGSNQEAITPRNALRLQALPQLEEWFPGAGAHIAQLSEAVSADEAYLSAQADALYLEAAYTAAPLFLLSVPMLENAPQAIRRRVLRRWYLEGLSAAGLYAEERALSHADTLALSQLPDQPAGTRVNLPCGLTAAKERDWLHLVHPSTNMLQTPFEIPVQAAPARYALTHLTLQAEPPCRLPQDASAVILSREWLEQRPVLRLPRPGDRIRPFGAPGHKPLRRCMTDRKADPFLRPHWPVLCAGSEVLWIPGLCAAEALRLSAVPPDGLQLTITGSTPFCPKPPKE